MPLREKNGRWEYRFQVSGKRICESTGLAATERNKIKAENLEAAHRLAVMEGRIGIRRLIVRSFTEAALEFETHTKLHRKASTASRIVTSLASAKLFFGKTLVSMLGPGDIERYKDWRVLVSKVRPVTLKHDLDNLSLFFQWAVRMEYCRQIATDGVDRPSDKDAVRERILTLAEERRYFAQAKGNLHDVGRIMILQGCRPDEVLHIQKTDFNLSRRTLRVASKTKAGNRVLKLTDEAYAILGRRLAVTPSQWLFWSEKRPGHPITKLNCPHDRLCKKLKLFFVLYDLRHTFATRMVKADANLMALRDIMGHSSIKITERYVHLAQDAKDEAMDLYNETLKQQLEAIKPS